MNSNSSIDSLISIICNLIHFIAIIPDKSINVFIITIFIYQHNNNHQNHCNTCLQVVVHVTGSYQCLHHQDPYDNHHHSQGCSPHPAKLCTFVDFLVQFALSCGFSTSPLAPPHRKNGPPSYMHNGDDDHHRNPHHDHCPQVVPS